MALFGSISIEVGANLSQLKVGLNESLSMIDGWGDKASRDVKSTWSKLGDSMSGIWDKVKRAFKKDLFTTLDMVSDGLSTIGDAISKLSGPLGVLPDKTQANIQKFGELAETGSDVASAFASVGRTLEPLNTMFPQIASIGKKAFSGLWRAITGPIGLAVAAFTGLGVLIYKNFDQAVSIITKAANSLITMYNESLVLRVGVEAAILPFKNLFAILKSGGRIAGIVFSGMGKQLEDLANFRFGNLASNFTETIDKIKKEGANLADEIAKNYKESWTNIAKGRDFITEEDTRKFLNPIRKIGDNVKSIWTSIFDPDGDMGAALDAMSDTWTSNFKETGKKAVAFIKKEIEEGLPKIGRGLGDGAIKPLDVPVNITIPERSKEAIKELSQSMREFSQDVGSGIADIFTNIFDGADSGRVKDLNKELKEQRAILTDTSADKATRDAARDRIELINQEIKAEKDKSNVVVQASNVIIDAVKKQLAAKLAEGIATLIPKVLSSIPFPANLLAVGGAVAALKAMFSSKIPKLASGGILTGRTLFEGGEYPGASINPEVVAPLDTLTDRIKKAVLPSMSMGGMQPAIIGGTIDTTIRGEDLYQLVKLMHQKEVRRTGRNFFINA